MQSAKKGMNKVILLSIVLSLLIIPFSSAGVFDWLGKTITGKVSSQPTNVSVSVTGVNPALIPFISQIGSVNPIENGVRKIAFNVYMYDADGVADLNDSSVSANFSKTGEPLRQNSSCVWINDIDAYRANYSCTIDMWYWDASGSWNVNAKGSDLGNGSIVYNNTQTFTYNELKAMVATPSALTWPGVSSGSANQTSNNDPAVINNTGNYNGTITVAAVDLLGESNPSYAIYAANFTAGLTTGAGNPECAGTSLVNSSAVTVSGSVANRGNHSQGGGAGQEQFYYCIPKTPQLTSQIYSTSQGGSWTISY